jgi:uncharacterized C2H2 Zn-finger protein
MHKFNSFVSVLKQDYPEVNFVAGQSFVWSPAKNQITYAAQPDNEEHAIWALVHELAHYKLGHKKYKSDFELLKLETEAWSKANQLAIDYNQEIDQDHIQDCLDTYRDWLHTRAKCPKCGVVSMQRKDLNYQCFNCKTVWSVPKSPLCRIKKELII